MTRPEMPKRIEIVYQEALDNISFIKKQEWIVAGYGLTIHAAVVAIWKQFPCTIWLQAALTCAAILAASYGLAVLHRYAQGLYKWRKRLKWIYKNHFEESERIELELGQRSKGTEVVFIGGLCLTLVVSTAVTLLIVWS
jgi:hypothetical protein